MRIAAFSKRNIIEYLRSPLNLFFSLLFPIIMFFIFQLIKFSAGLIDEMAPMFKVENLIPSIAVFSFTFIALTTSIQIAKDRETAFQMRLCASPMKPFEFFVGYFCPCILLAVAQIFISYILGICFGLQIKVQLIYGFFALIFASIFYISLGILIGSLFSEKTCGGISSILVNLAAIFSGMFFPLEGGTFKTVLSFMPFLPSVDITRKIIASSSADLLQNFIVLASYTLISVLLSVFALKHQLKTKK